MTALSTTSIGAVGPLRAEFAASDRRTRRFTAVSLGVHALLLLWFVLQRQLAPATPELVEITWIEPEPLPAAISAPPAPEPVVTPQVVERPEPVAETPVEEERFERPEPEAPVQPEPQRPEATSDRLARSLEQLKSAPPKADLSALASARPAAITRPSASTVAKAPTAAGSELVRGEKTERPTPRALRRESAPASPRPSNLAAVDLPSPTTRSEAPRTLDENVARRSIEGAMLMGEVADRPLRERVVPVYPDRARREAVEASVTLRFTVLADGRVQSNVMVERGSGHADFDRNAVAALRQWRFEPLPAGRTGEQWGAITFHFRLRDR